MTDYYAQAKALREQVAQLDEQATDARYIPRSSDFSDANELWCEHVRLFFRPTPNPTHAITSKSPCSTPIAMMPS